jgi:hypothetical protein
MPIEEPHRKIVELIQIDLCLVQIVWIRLINQRSHQIQVSMLGPVKTHGRGITRYVDSGKRVPERLHHRLTDDLETLLGRPRSKINVGQRLVGIGQGLNAIRKRGITPQDRPAGTMLDLTELIGGHEAGATSILGRSERRPRAPEAR